MAHDNRVSFEVVLHTPALVEHEHATLVTLRSASTGTDPQLPDLGSASTTFTATVIPYPLNTFECLVEASTTVAPSEPVETICTYTANRPTEAVTFVAAYTSLTEPGWQLEIASPSGDTLTPADHGETAIFSTNDQLLPGVSIELAVRAYPPSDAHSGSQASILVSVDTPQVSTVIWSVTVSEPVVNQPSLAITDDSDALTCVPPVASRPGPEGGNVDYTCTWTSVGSANPQITAWLQDTMRNEVIVSNAGWTVEFRTVDGTPLGTQGTQRPGCAGTIEDPGCSLALWEGDSLQGDDLVFVVRIAIPAGADSGDTAETRIVASCDAPCIGGLFDIQTSVGEKELLRCTPSVSVADGQSLDFEDSTWDGNQWSVTTGFLALDVGIVDESMNCTGLSGGYSITVSAKNLEAANGGLIPASSISYASTNSGDAPAGTVSVSGQVSLDAETGTSIATTVETPDYEAATWVVGFILDPSSNLANGSHPPAGTYTGEITITASVSSET